MGPSPSRKTACFKKTPPGIAGSRDRRPRRQGRLRRIAEFEHTARDGGVSGPPVGKPDRPERRDFVRPFVLVDRHTERVAGRNRRDGSREFRDWRRILPGFDSSTLPANDDASTGAVPLGFTVDFFGQDESSLYINNNGNVTFGAPFSDATPLELADVQDAIIAPFFADVDTKTGNAVTYGTGTVDGHPAFGVTWPGVGYYDNKTDKLNEFQLILIDRSDTGPGNFDIEFNYDQIQWESGDASGGTDGLGGTSARAGFSGGTGQPGTYVELPGSGVDGAFLDSNDRTGLVHNSGNSSVLGQYIFPIRDGAPLSHATAAFVQANPGGTTTLKPTGVVFGQEPSLLTEVEQIVQYRVQAGLTSDPRQLTSELVQGLIDGGSLPSSESDAFIASVLQSVPPGPQPLVLTLAPPAPVAGESIANVVVATLNDSDASDLAADLTATITWGDGAVSTATAAAGTISENSDGTFSIFGSHMYTAASSGLDFSVAVTDTAGARDTQSTQIRVQADPLSVTLAPPAPLVGNPLDGVLVATFRDAKPVTKADNFVVTIGWGDGTSSTATIGAGTIRQNADGSYSIYGTHTYDAAAPALSFSVLVNDVAARKPARVLRSASRTGWP